MFIIKIYTLFQLWRKENLVKCQKVSKCYDYDCSFTEAMVQNCPAEYLTKKGLHSRFCHMNFAKFLGKPFL